MPLFSERNGLRGPREHTSVITIEMYQMLFEICKKYYNNLAWMFQDDCPDGFGCCGFNVQKFNKFMLFKIPNLIRDDNNQIREPEKGWGNDEGYDQYALLDLIEFIGQNCRDFEYGSYHSFFDHYHFILHNTCQVFIDFQKEINDLFDITGLQFRLSDTKIIERVLENNEVISEVRSLITSVKERGLKELIEEAVNLFMAPDPTKHNLAIDKIWDAFERLKTAYSTSSKKASIEQLIKIMGSGQKETEELFEKEFTMLTMIGNEYRIRHHEVGRTEIIDERHYDYLFNRCLTLIVAAIKFL